MEKSLIYTKDIKKNENLRYIKKIIEKNFVNIPVRLSFSERIFNKMLGIDYNYWKEMIRDYYIESEYNDILSSTFNPDSRIIYLYDEKELVGLIKIFNKNKNNYFRECFDYETKETDALVTLFYLKKEYNSYYDSIIKEMEKELPLSIGIEDIKFISNNNEDLLLALINNGYSADKDYHSRLVMEKHIQKREDNYARKRKPKWHIINK